MEPTQPAYDSTQPEGISEYPSQLYFDIAPPPPPPPRKSSRKWLLVAVLFSLVLILISTLDFALFTGKMNSSASQGLGGQASRTWIPTSMATSTFTPTTQPLQTNYTASDIFEHLGAHPFNGSEQQNISIYAWTDGAYSDYEVQEQSSVTWSDISSCTGPCDPINYGLWAYGSAADTQTAYNQVSNEMLALTPTGQTYYPTDPSQMVTAGRCLLLGADARSQYAHVIQQYCV